MPLTFYWHDYETWGADPRRDRAAQFAGIRTDAELNPIGRPLMVYCKPADDMLPQPEACLITGITPQRALSEGVCEADFFAAVHAELASPGTCGVGYNTLRFDDEFTRYGLYRNFFDPYGREWQNGNSRWDIIDMVRLTHALRPEGIEWPRDDAGNVSFKLERLTAANGIAHVGAHDALADVQATIALAKLIRERQPRLFGHILELRDKRKVAPLLELRNPRPVLHVSSRYPASRGCLAMVLPVARHPTNANGVIVYDLREDPEPLISLPLEEVHKRLFTPAADLPEGSARIPLKTIHINRCPVVVSMNTLTPEAAVKWGIDTAAGLRHMQQLLAMPGLAEKIQAVHRMAEFEGSGDPDHALYGGFFSDADRRRIEQVRTTAPEQLAALRPAFEDRRLPELLFRYRARNWPETLSKAEREAWEEYRKRRLTDPEGGGSIALKEYRRQLAKRMVDLGLSERERGMLSELADWPAMIGV